MATVDVRACSIYLPAAVVDTYFRGIDAVILLVRDGALHVLPVARMESGGCLLKRRNAIGDRVATAPDVFEAHGLQNWAAQDLDVHWSQADSALIVPFTANKVCNVKS